MGTSSIFTGSSSFSTDFQNVITRAVAIASLPITQLKVEKTDLGGQSTALTSLDSKFASLQTAIANIGNALVSNSLTSSVSDSTHASVNVGSGAMQGTYNINVSDIGAYGTMLSNTWDETVGTPHTYKLSIGSDSYDITPTDNTAASMAAAINANYGTKVHATVLIANNGTPPDYRISLLSATMDTNALDITDGVVPVSLQAPGTATEGRPLIYSTVAGQTITSSSRSITVSPGLTVNVLKTDAALQITVSQSTSGLTNALSGFVTAYNAAVDAVGQQRGTSGGALAGDSVVSALNGILRNLSTYSDPTNSPGGFASFGLNLEKDGRFSFDITTPSAAGRNAFSTAFAANPTGIAAFLGSATGGGFLKAATDSVDSVEQTDTGLMKTAAASVQSQIFNIDKRIEDRQAGVDLLQANLQRQMAAADTLIASMQQQYSFLTSMLEAMQASSQQYK